METNQETKPETKPESIEEAVATMLKRAAGDDWLKEIPANIEFIHAN